MESQWNIPQSPGSQPAVNALTTSLLRALTAPYYRPASAAPAVRLPAPLRPNTSLYAQGLSFEHHLLLAFSQVIGPERLQSLDLSRGQESGHAVEHVLLALADDLRPLLGRPEKIRIVQDKRAEFALKQALQTAALFLVQLVVTHVSLDCIEQALRLSVAHSVRDRLQKRRPTGKATDNY
jgi:hypothetical protein